METVKDIPNLDPGPILDIHRGNPDGYVAFLSKPGKEKSMQNIAAVKVRDVKETLPGLLAQWVNYDGYFSVNSYAIAGNVWKRTGFKYPLRKEKNLLELAACYADLDVGRKDTISFETAQIKALKLQRAGHIPPFSIMACSGRGMYLFWLLKDNTDPETLPRANGASVIKYKRINKALHRRLYDLEVDRAAFDAARVLRIPGSIHRKTKKRVEYSLTIQADKGGKLCYTLPELETYLNIQAPTPSLPDDVREKARPQIYTRKPYRETKEKGSTPSRKAGYKRINELRAKDLETIEQWRQGFLKAGLKYADGFSAPGRLLMLRLYAQWLRKAGKGKRAVYKAVRTMAGNCKPPYPSDPSDCKLRVIIKDAFSDNPHKHFANIQTDKLCGWTGINENTDPGLLAELDTIIPPTIKARRDKKLPHQDDFTKHRRKAIKEHLKKTGGRWPSLRKMSRILESKGIINPATNKPWSFEIIRKDKKDIFF